MLQVSHNLWVVSIVALGNEMKSLPDNVVLDAKRSFERFCSEPLGLMFSLYTFQGEEIWLPYLIYSLLFIKQFSTPNFHYWFIFSTFKIYTAQNLLSGLYTFFPLFLSFAFNWNDCKRGPATSLFSYSHVTFWLIGGLHWLRLWAYLKGEAKK